MNVNSMPSLTEPGVKYFLRETLKNCNVIRTNYYNMVWNCGFFLLFILVFGIFLAYRKKNKLTPEQKRKKDEEGHAHVMTKIKALREERRKINNEIITNLPKFENDFETMHKKYYAI